MDARVWWCLVTGVAVRAAGTADAWAAAGTFEVTSTVLLAELGGGAAREVGYRLRGALSVVPLAAAPAQHELLLSFRLSEMQLQLRGAHASAEWAPRGSLWDGGRGGEWRVLWGRGAPQLWLDPAEPRDVRNYKRALTSLFQFQVSEGRHNETDISGECEAVYEGVAPAVLRKTKRRCAFEAEVAALGARARRVARYTRAGEGGELLALHSEEVLWLPAGQGQGQGEGTGEEQVGVKARSWHALERRGGAGGGGGGAVPEGAEALEGALGARPASLRPAPLPLPLDERDHEQEDDEDEEEDLEAALERHGAALGGGAPGAGGGAQHAAALHPLLRALSAADSAALQRLLRRDDLQDRLAGLCRALGLAGTRAAWGAARALLAPAAQDAARGPVVHYLAGLALARRPAPGVVRDVLALAEEARVPALAHAALLAGAAAAGRLPEADAAAAQDRLLRGLARRRDPASRAVWLRALGNLRRAECAGALLAAAERGAGAEAEAALGALRGCALSAQQAERAARLAGEAARALPERALALELAVERLCAAEARALPLALVRLARALGAERGAAAGELRRALWGRLDALAQREAVRALRRHMPRDLASWDAQAPPGTTSTLARALGWRAGRREARLQSTLLAARGLLLRGRVALLADTHTLLAVEVWTRGLAAVAGAGGAGGAGGDEGDAGAEEEGGPAAGLQLAVGGVALPPLTLFDGQAELLGHIWAGTGSSATPVLRALVPGGAGRARVPLGGGAALALGGAAAGALALDAAGGVSLWQRSARARLHLRVAGHEEATARLRTGWAALRARAVLTGEARLRVAPDLDFYDGVALCVRADVQPHVLESRWELESAGGARALRVVRRRTARRARAGRTLALGRDNDVACRARAASDPDDDE